MPIQQVADGNSELLDAVEKASTQDYGTIGEDAPPGQGGRARKALRLLTRLVGQLDRAAGGDGCGVPDEEVPEVA